MIPQFLYFICSKSNLKNQYLGKKKYLKILKKNSQFCKNNTIPVLIIVTGNITIARFCKTNSYFKIDKNKT